MLALPGHTSKQGTGNKPKNHLTEKPPYKSANHRFRRRFQGLDVNTERVVACFGQYLNRSHYLEDQGRLGYNLAAGHAKEDRFRR